MGKKIMMNFEYTQDDKDNFWKNIKKMYNKDGTDACWLWQGHITANGYGYFPNSSNTTLPHRFSVQLHGRIIPPKWDVNHKCRTRNCVNPSHLNIMSHSKNMKLIGIKQNLNDGDEKYYSQEKQIFPMSQLQMCVRALEGEFFNIGEVSPEYIHELGELNWDSNNSDEMVKNIKKATMVVGGHNVAKMISFKRLTAPQHYRLSTELDGEDIIFDEFKRKYFWLMDHIINEYDTQWKKIWAYYVYDRKYIQRH